MGGSPRIERRRHERFAVRLTVGCSDGDGWSSNQLQDLSRSGARLKSSQRPPIGAAILLSITPDMLTRARVVRHTRDGFAVAFETPAMSGGDA